MRSVKTSLFFVAMAAALALSGSARATEGPISYWKFDEESGTTAYDSIGDNDGTIYGATWTTGMVGAALQFDGLDDYVDCLQSGPSGAAPRTVCAWARTSYLDAQNILSYGGSANNYGSTFRLGLNYWGLEGAFADISGGNVTYCATVADGEWHHYAAVVPNMTSPAISHVRVYQDATLLTTICDSYNPGWLINTMATPPIDIGRFHDESWISCQYFNGTIDEVVLFDRALTDGEIQAVYQSGPGSGQWYRAIAIKKIEEAITEKVEALESINAALEREWAAFAALEELLASGDYGDLNKADISRAKQNISAAIQQQEQSKNALEKSLQKLEDSLRLLGAEVQP